MSENKTSQINIYNNYEAWKSNIKQYEHEKKNLQWGSNPKPEVITHKKVKEKENIFNPVSQLYYDNDYNKYLRKSEQQKIGQSIAKNYDKNLRNEQTFDVINLRDKLSGFENHPDYPKFKSEFANKKNLEVSKANYNILSNITLDEQNYLPPDKRPIINEEHDHEAIKMNKVNVVNFKDYNIISNKYKFNHDEKLQADKEISQLNAANNYWKTRDYNHVKGAYYDSKKEEEYQKERKIKEDNWVKHGARHNKQQE
jgi:hypothetical protein